MSVVFALVRSEAVMGPGVVPLGSPFHQRVNQHLYFPPQVGLGLGSEFGHCRWTQLVMDQTFRYWFMDFV